MKRVQQGFTLIELMIVVAIIGILAAVALPAYQDYTARAQASEGSTLADGVKKELELSFSQDKLCPSNATATDSLAAAASIKGKYVASVATAGTPSSTGGCTVTVTFASSNVATGVSGKKIEYTMVQENNTTSWTCKTDLGPKIGPKGCGTL
jgi:type IV pilus assembly protein PilA